MLKRFFQVPFFLGIFSFLSLQVAAHFGSKGPYGGTVSCSIAYDTTTYIGTANGGVFESTSSKLIGWRARPVGLLCGKITALAHSGKYLYAATADSGVYIFTGYVGSDRYWKKTNTGLTNLKIRSLLAIDSLTLLAGTEGNGIFKSIDKGATWLPVSNTIFSTSTVTSFALVGNRVFLSVSDKGVFMSADKGASWSDFNDSHTLNIAGTISLSPNIQTNELAVINANGIYNLATAGTAVSPVYTLMTTGLPGATDFRHISNNGLGWFLATNKGVFLTPAAGINWIPANTGLGTMNVNTVLPFKNTLFAGTIGEGIFKSDVSTVSWNANNFGFNNLITYSMACSGVAVVVAATEKGVFVSKDLANSYKKANNGLTDSLNVTSLTFFGTKLLAATKNAGVFISTDTGATWNSWNAGLINLNIKQVIASSDAVYLFDTNGNVYQAQGSNWVGIQMGLPNDVKPTCMAFFGNKMVLGTSNHQVFISSIGVNSWQLFNASLMTGNITSLTVSKDKLFAGTAFNGVWVRDTSALGFWQNASPTSIAHTTLMGLNGNSIQAMSTYAGYVFASYKGGVLATSDNGKTWIAGGNQFNLPSYTNVSKIDFVTTRIFVTTENNCLYSNALSELPNINGINKYNLNMGTFTVYPNPSEGVVTIDLRNIAYPVQQVIIYDATGRKTDSFQPALLTNTIRLQVAAGVYYAHVLTDKGTLVQKIVIKQAQ